MRCSITHSYLKVNRSGGLDPTLGMAFLLLYVGTRFDGVDIVVPDKQFSGLISSFHSKIELRFRASFRVSV